MRVATTVALALCIALPAPIAANASAPSSRSTTSGLTCIRQSTDRSTRLRPLWRRRTPSSRSLPTVKSDDDYDGLSRDRDQCNRGCIDEGGG